MERTGQGRAGQGRAGQDRTGQDRTGQDRTGKERRPSIVSHTWSLRSAFNLSKCNKHTHCEHTPGAVSSQCCGIRGADRGSMPCSRVSPQSWYWRWRERWTFTPPTYNSCRTWDSNPQPFLQVRLSNHSATTAPLSQGFWNSGSWVNYKGFVRLWKDGRLSKCIKVVTFDRDEKNKN